MKKLVAMSIQQAGMAAVCIGVLTLILIFTPDRVEAAALGTISGIDTVTETQLENVEVLLGRTDTEADYAAAQEKITWKTNFKKADLRLLSALIYAEANGMGYDAKAAVGNVVLNRMYDMDDWGHVTTISEVIYDTKWGTQFSPTKDGSLKKALAIYDSMDPEVYKDWQIEAMTACKQVAKDVLAGYRVVPDDFMYFNSHVETQSRTCMEKGWSFVIIEKHIYSAGWFIKAVCANGVK